MDCYQQSKEDVHDEFLQTFCYTDIEMMTKIRNQQLYGVDIKTRRPELFGPSYGRHCICVVAGQVPCPAYEKLPKEMRGKFNPLNARNKWRKAEEEVLGTNQETEV
ncbi:uncharacterized protein LOC134236166 isoform X1 [Saccostrea cucullata]|uniref:uncharacterized protein LOC134236166 isoform X1 n=2 Tax=Saccostrea cuccullata TaxID=36930 RepID=UPI002ED2761D